MIDIDITAVNRANANLRPYLLPFLHLACFKPSQHETTKNLTNIRPTKHPNGSPYVKFWACLATSKNAEQFLIAQHLLSSFLPDCNLRHYWRFGVFTENLHNWRFASHRYPMQTSANTFGCHLGCLQGGKQVTRRKTIFDGTGFKQKQSGPTKEINAHPTRPVGCRALRNVSAIEVERKTFRSF